MPDLHSLDINTAYACLAGTSKHVFSAVSLAEHVEEVADMCFTVAGSREAFYERPFLSLNINPPVPPMRFDADSCEVMAEAARLGIPLHSNTFGQMAASSPVTIAGTVAQTIAETLSGMIFGWLVNPAAKIVFGTRPLVTDLRTGAMSGGSGEAAITMAALMGPESIVITIQNGLGAGERIAQFMEADRVLLGVADGFGASMKGPGHVHHSAMNLIRVGEMNGGMSERLERIAEVWREAGFNARAFEDIDQLIWGKYICNVAFSGPCTVFDRSLGELMADPASWSIAQGCALEVLALGNAKNIAFSFDDAIEYITAFGQKMPDARPSMLLDHHAKRPSEIDAINGMAVELGKQLGIATPYNELLTAVIRQREAEF